MIAGFCVKIYCKFVDLLCFLIIFYTLRCAGAAALIVFIIKFSTGQEHTMPGRKKLSIEIGPDIIRAAEITCRRKEIDVNNVLEIKTPSECFRDGYILNPDRLGEILSMQLAAAGINTKDTVFSVTSDEILVGDADIARGNRRSMEEAVISSACELFGLAPSSESSDGEKADDSGGDEAGSEDNDSVQDNGADGRTPDDDYDGSGSGAVSIDSYCVSYKAAEESEDGTSDRVIIFAAPTALIDTYRLLAERAQPVLEAADCSMNSAYQWMKRAFGHEAVMLVRLDDNESSAAIMTDEVLRGHYVLSTSAADLLHAVDEFNTMSDFEGTDDFHDGMSDSDNLVIKASYPLTEELKQIVQSFLANNQSEYLDKIIIAGEGEGMLALAQQIQKQIGIPTMTLEDLPDGTFVKNIEPFGELDPGRFINVVGAVIDPLDFATAAAGGILHGVKQELVRKIVIGVLAALIIIMAVTGVRYMLLRSHSSELNTQLGNVKYIEDIYNQYKDAENKNSEVSAIDKSTQQKNELLSQLYSDLESKMPTQAKITSMNSSDDLVTFSITAPTKETAAEMILQLRQFDYLDDISVSELTDTTNASGKEAVEFTVSATLTGDSSKDYSLSDGANDDGLSDSGKVISLTGN